MSGWMNKYKGGDLSSNLFLFKRYVLLVRLCCNKLSITRWIALRDIELGHSSQQHMELTDGELTWIHRSSVEPSLAIRCRSQVPEKSTVKSMLVA